MLLRPWGQDIHPDWMHPVFWRKNGSIMLQKDCALGVNNPGMSLVTVLTKIRLDLGVKANPQGLAHSVHGLMLGQPMSFET